MGACSSKPKTRDGAIEPSKKISTENPTPENVKILSSQKEEDATASVEVTQERRELPVAFVESGNTEGRFEKEKLEDEAGLGLENAKEDTSEAGIVANEKGEVKFSDKGDAIQGEEVNQGNGIGGEADAKGLAIDSVEEKEVHVADASAANEDQAMKVSVVPQKDLDASGVRVNPPVVQDDTGAVPCDSGKALEMDDVPSVEPSDVSVLQEGASVASYVNDVPCEDANENIAAPEIAERDYGPSVGAMSVSTVPEGASAVDDVPLVIPTDVDATSSVAPVMVVETTGVSNLPVKNEAGTDVEGSCASVDGILVTEVDAGKGVLSEMVALIPEGNSSAVESDLQDVKVDEAGGESAGGDADPIPAAADVNVKESGTPAHPHVEKVVEENTGEGVDETRDEAFVSVDGQSGEGKAEAIADDVNAEGKSKTIPCESVAEDVSKSESVQAPEQVKAMLENGEPALKVASDVPVEPEASTQ